MIKELKYSLAGIAIFVWLITMMSIAFAKDVTFRGKVVDADTKEPIEGAVVVVYWLEAWQTIAGEGTKHKEVKECLTDKNGEWSIVGQKGKPHDPHPYLSFFLGISYIREPSFIIFKPGYCSYPNGFYIDACKEKLKPSGAGKIMAGETIELPKLEKREDRLRSKPGPIAGEGALEKQREFIRLLDEEARNLGIPEYKYFKGRER